jgi:hypothetical protein
MAFDLQYYDLVLLGIVVAMGIGAAVGYATAFAMPTSITGAGLVAVGLIGHGLFVNGPIDEPADLADEVETEEVVPEAALPLD